MTEELLLEGDRVVHLRVTNLHEWQLDYYVLDLHQPGFAFAPRDQENMHPVFRIQHSFSPTHCLRQSKYGRSPTLVCLKPLHSREELTFTYDKSVFQRLRDMNTQTSTETGMVNGGSETSSMMYARLTTRVRMLGGHFLYNNV